MKIDGVGTSNFEKNTGSQEPKKGKDLVGGSKIGKGSQPALGNGVKINLGN